nr:MAG TPA: hypothetical protein [Caudoviricetes sp.]
MEVALYLSFILGGERLDNCLFMPNPNVLQ